MIDIEFKPVVRTIIIFNIILVLFAALAACSVRSDKHRLPVRVLILPKFEVDEMSGDFPGEAQCFYEEYLAVGQAVKRFGLLDRLIVLRVSVNMDVFPTGITPEMLWGQEPGDHLASGESMESIDIFETAMRNCFVTGKVLIEEILKGKMD